MNFLAFSGICGFEGSGGSGPFFGQIFVFGGFLSVHLWQHSVLPYSSAAVCVVPQDFPQFPELRNFYNHCFLWLIDWLIDWLIAWFIDCLCTGDDNTSVSLTVTQMDHPCCVYAGIDANILCSLELFSTDNVCVASASIWSWRWCDVFIVSEAHFVLLWALHWCWGLFCLVWLLNCHNLSKNRTLH